MGLSYLFTDEEVKAQNSYSIIQAEPAFQTSLAPEFMFSTDCTDSSTDIMSEGARTGQNAKLQKKLRLGVSFQSVCLKVLEVGTSHWQSGGSDFAFQFEDAGSIPGQGAKIAHASWPNKRT